MSAHCCPEYEKQIEEGAIEVFPDGAVNVPGCCGGGCCVLHDLKFCPFCGRAILAEVASPRT